MEDEYEQLIGHYRVGGYSKNYITVLDCLMKRLPSPAELTVDWTLSFLSQFENPRTRKQYCLYLKVIYRRIGRMDAMPDVKFKAQKDIVKRVDLLTDDEFDSLIRACKTSTERAVIGTLHLTGVRASELLSIAKSDVEIGEQLVMLTVRGKTGERTVPVPIDSMTDFLEHYATVDSGMVFDFSYRSLRLKVIGIFKRAGVRKRGRTIHIFRHGAATRFIEMGMPEPLVRQYMGWSPNSNMVSIYVHLSNRSLVDFFLRKSIEVPQ